MLAKNFIILTNNLCLGRGNAEALWIEVRARLDLDPSQVWTSQKHVSYNKQPFIFQVKNSLKMSFITQVYATYSCDN